MNGKTTAGIPVEVYTALEGLNVEVVAGPILHDALIKPLTREGARMVVDRLVSLGFKVEKV